MNKLDRVAPLVGNTTCANSTTDTDTHPLRDIGDQSSIFKRY